MNTSHLEIFAKEARTKLIEQVSAKLSFVLTTDSVELREKTEQIKQLREELVRNTKEQLIEKVAYTWFNRLMALRFMDANDYQPLGIRIISPKDGYTTPEILDEAKRGNIPEELKLKRQKVHDLLDNRIPSANPQNEAFKELLIAACNHLNTTFSFLFEKINDYTELLLPDDLTSDFSIVTDIRKGMPADDCKNVEIIGWLYQFYVSEKKDAVMGSKEKVKKEDIPAATQLFTPRWIVEYLVQNTVGKLWLQNRPKSRLREHMPYFIESASLTSSDYLKINSPEEIKLLDPASGSGHILVYAFDLFIKIYEEEGYNPSDIPNLIIKNNLYGFEIDERAAQLTGLALMMKAREYQRRTFRKDLLPNILCFQDLNLNSDEIKVTLTSLQIKITEELMHDLIQIQQAKNIGSLIIPNTQNSEINNVIDKLIQLSTSADVFQRNKIDSLLIAFDQLNNLSKKYHCVVTNPPYMGRNNMNDFLWDFLKINYSISCEDTMTCFMEMSSRKVFNNGYVGMINIPSWLTLKSFSSFRKYLIKNVQFDTIIHNGRGIFGADFGSISFTFLKNNIDNKQPTIIRKLFKKFSNVDNLEKKRAKFFAPDFTYEANFNDFEKLPEYVFAYWLTASELVAFREFPNCDELYHVKQGMATGENERFLRFWHELSFSTIGYGYQSINQALKSDKRFFPYNKGGAYKKWYGNIDYVIRFDIANYEILNNQGNRIPSKEFQFKTSVTWSKVTAGKFSVRYRDDGALFDVSGCSIFEKGTSLYVVMALLNSSLNYSFLENISTSVNYEVGQVKAFPCHPESISSELLINKAQECVEICREEFNYIEGSPKFLGLPIITNIINGSLEESFIDFLTLCVNKEKRLNTIENETDDFILKLFNIQRTPDFSKSIIYDWVKDDSYKLNLDLFHSMISYFAGCLFGRYSLDKEGLILANQGESLQHYLHKISKSMHECSFLPDEDNIVPILENEWFEDDIVGQFNQFLKATFGEENFNKNISFIEENIGKDIRKYFTKDFYPEHIKRYKKRPIYWMFTSPKGSFNVLIYMHRYTADTVSNILNKYLKEFIGKLKTRKEHLQHIQVSGSPAEKTKAIKESDSIDKMLIELQEYERDILFPLATERISIDLDDGVLVNYNKFGKAVKEVAGLNDSATKKKVREFDWIDTSQIR